MLKEFARFCLLAMLPAAVLALTIAFDLPLPH